ncbi:flagellar protein FlaG [Massilia sp. GCM10020059]|uniref:Flagellar protein FlaG n=1 Tax=Massilia agrisoli TaxID=2892444 RepID=A0ABS8IUC7_9BURK|nr:flagellar protein FlaG [Massilia agrisoli]MCC6071338.1 flagellar protein FlaG [Massilia agrisoli]
MQVQPFGGMTPKTEPYDRQAAPVSAPAAPPVKFETRNPVAAVDAEPAQAEVADALKTINKTVQAMSPSLEFSIDADSKRTVVKVVDMDTKEVIRQMPSVEALEIAKALDRLQGLLIRQKA